VPCTAGALTGRRWQDTAASRLLDNSVDREGADAKALSYLDHRDDVEEWATLRAEGRALLEKYLLGMSERLAEFVSSVGADSRHPPSGRGEVAEHALDAEHLDRGYRRRR
jgi:hypothetical protein